jgi:uncharacterized protein YggU (UPF0235/DUF167 family)
LVLTVRLTPRASRDGLDGVRVEADGRPVLGLRVTAAPVDGAANAALIAFVARNLGLRRGDVALVAGDTARIKRLRLSGDPNRLAARIDDWIADRDGRC